MELKDFPFGCIIIWASKKENVPEGWTICNGENGTPNLVDRFPLGTVNSAEIGDKVGNAEHSHSVVGVTDAPDDITQASGDNRALQKDGNERFHHTHSFSANTSSVPLLPLSTKVMFIMKVDLNPS